MLIRISTVAVVLEPAVCDNRWKTWSNPWWLEWLGPMECMLTVLWCWRFYHRTSMWPSSSSFWGKVLCGWTSKVQNLQHQGRHKEQYCSNYYQPSTTSFSAKCVIWQSWVFHCYLWVLNMYLKSATMGIFF